MGTSGRLGPPYWAPGLAKWGAEVGGCEERCGERGGKRVVSALEKYFESVQSFPAGGDARQEWTVSLNLSSSHTVFGWSGTLIV